MLVLLSIFVVIFVAALAVFKRLTPAGPDVIASFLWRGAAGGALGGVACLHLLFFFLAGPYLLPFSILHSAFTPLWGMTFALVVGAVSAKSESQMAAGGRGFVGVLLGLATGVTLALNYPLLLGLS